MKTLKKASLLTIALLSSLANAAPGDVLPSADLVGGAVTPVERVDSPSLSPSSIDRIEAVGRVEKGEYVERAERVERIEKAERPERIEKAERPEHIEKVERPEHIEKVEKVERIEKVERPERIATN